MARQKNMKRRRAILCSTFALLREKGIKNVSLKMIAERSNISKSLLQSYYPHKNKLITEIIIGFKTTILRNLPQASFYSINEFAKVKAFIYLILQIGMTDKGISQILESILKDRNNKTVWDNILDDWLVANKIKDKLGTNEQVQVGLSFVVSGGTNLYFKRKELNLSAEDISNIMIKSFMTTFLNSSDQEINEAITEGHDMIVRFDMNKVFKIINSMFLEEE